jgi:hypothetical protein
LFQYIAETKKRDKAGNTNMIELLETDQAKNLAESLAFTQEILTRYDSTSSKARRIIDAIKKEYGE